MGKFNPDEVAQWVEQDSTQTEFQPVRLVLNLCLRGRIASYSDERIAELAEELESSVGIALERRATAYLDDGISPPFEVSVEQGASYFKSLPKTETSLLGDLRKASPAGFEVFCKMILMKLKADAVVEGGPHDGGVDFYALGLPLGDSLHPSPRPSKAVVIGQSKRYAATKTVSEVELRSFVGGAVKRLHDLRGQYPDRFGLLTPVLLAFWTTSDFTSSAKTYARALGLWYLNGVGLAQLATRIGLKREDVEGAAAEAEKVRLDRLPNMVVPDSVEEITPSDELDGGSSVLPFDY